MDSETCPYDDYHEETPLVIDTSFNIHVNPERKFRGTKWRPAERSETGFGRGVRWSFPGYFQKPVLQMMQSEVFLSYICEL